MLYGFEWWLNVFSNTEQFNSIRTDPYACLIFLDVSLTVWGAFCDNQRTHGWWGPEDLSLHINALELKATFYTFKCFASDRRGCNILLRIDNTTAISYINKFGSIHHSLLSEIARNIWKWCEGRHIFLFASYIASIDNVIADSESRILHFDTEWFLSTRAFRSIERTFGIDPFDIDLFASLLNAKNETYAS